MVALKRSNFSEVDNSTAIYQGDLLCTGSESNLSECNLYENGERDCQDHSEDAGVRCNGEIGDP